MPTSLLAFKNDPLRARAAAAILAEMEKRRQRVMELERVRANADAIRGRCRRLSGFAREAWHFLEPEREYSHNWHIDAVCEHLEAVTFGDITRLLMNVPPGSMKSLLVSVLWQAWEAGPMGRPGLRYLTTAFKEDAVLRDSRKCRDLILSEWYQALWPSVTLVRTGERSWSNTYMGGRECSAFGSLTQKRGDRLVIDDPHSIDTAESDLDRKRTIRQFREGSLNRLNDQAKSAIVVIMQRLHEEDVSGTILSVDMGYTHLCLPMRYETDGIGAGPTSIGFRDPRRVDGELLDEKRFPAATVDQIEHDTTAYAWAGQYQQRPSPRGGGMFKRAWFDGRIIEEADVPRGTRWVRHWDLAATKKETAARTAGVKIGRTPDGRYIVGHVITTQEEGPAVRTLITTTAGIDTKDVAISLPQDPGQAGKVQSQDMVAMLAGFNASAEIESGAKETRAEPFAAQCAAGNVSLVRGVWNESYLDELCAFPTSKFKDQVDASSGAFGRLVSTAGNMPVYTEEMVNELRAILGPPRRF